ncbi:DEAD/DEAH box helicase family protein [Teichococcus vastitatis]|uniref:AAA family ATPase n=1 Tax=Teichococcus vastitatis TaxID=2307076 RepID=A0ABS9W6M1_9PROT|nr:nucleoside kinase [Pseudoroseomonas vastitatis]MCI0754555.1 AAA family ATPase [Pseudoroseomonas vastitatis]
MGIRNYLIEGVSGTGKTSVATELERGGYHVIHGDRELAYKGDPRTGEPLDETALKQAGSDAAFGHEHHIWNTRTVADLIADRSHPISFFCGGSRNFDQFIALFDQVFVLTVDSATLNLRLSSRPEDEFGGNPSEQELIARRHASQGDVPEQGLRIDANAPLLSVVDHILRECCKVDQRSSRPAQR